MNKRIFEIAEQCTVSCVDGRGVELNEIDVEKFVKLIVEECRYVMDCSKGSDQHTEWNRALFETSEKIKLYFGIEKTEDKNG